MTEAAEAGKRAAAAAAVALVRPGMKIGLGTGSTALEFIRLLGEQVRAGLEVVAVATSEASARAAEGEGMVLGTLDELAPLDLTVDGADEVDWSLNLIKGGGGALLREKIVAQASQAMVVVADSSKLVETLGAYPLPVEIVRFGHQTTIRAIAEALDACALPAEVTLRRGPDGSPFVSDEGNLIADCACRRIADPPGAATALGAIAGVVEHGLFVGIASNVLIGACNGVRSLPDRR